MREHDTQFFTVKWKYPAEKEKQKPRVRERETKKLKMEFQIRTNGCKVKLWGVSLGLAQVLLKCIN